MEPTDIGEEASKLIKVHNIGNFISKGVSGAILGAGLLVLVYLIWGGVELIISTGDKAKIESAQGRITAALIGLVIVAAAWVVWKVVLYFLGVGRVDVGGSGGVGFF